MIANMKMLLEAWYGSLVSSFSSKIILVEFFFSKFSSIFQFIMQNRFVCNKIEQNLELENQIRTRHVGKIQFEAK